jgi:hypothetical protein
MLRTAESLIKNSVFNISNVSIDVFPISYTIRKTNLILHVIQFMTQCINKMRLLSLHASADFLLDLLFYPEDGGHMFLQTTSVKTQKTLLYMSEQNGVCLTPDEMARSARVANYATCLINLPHDLFPYSKISPLHSDYLIDASYLFWLHYCHSPGNVLSCDHIL